MGYIFCNRNWKAVKGSHFGRGQGEFLLDEVKCTGEEETLADCQHDGWKQHNCYAWEQAGVKCYSDQCKITHTL